MNRRLLLSVLALAVVLLAVLQPGQANFNAATGFSGRHGFTCTSCHNVPPPGYPEATLVVEGFPDAWDAQGAYTFTIRIEGGPPALAGPAPQGGFEIESDRGTFSVTPGMEDYIQVYAPGAVTYTAEGALLREWRVTWHAPSLDARPEDARFWVAGLAANGNHVVALGQADGGELGDAVDNLTTTVPASPAALDAWTVLRLQDPVVDPAAVVPVGSSITVTGRHTDPEATHLGYRLDDQPWSRQATAASWTLEVRGLTAGEHVLLVRSESETRQSDDVVVPLKVLAPEVPTKESPAPFLVLLPALAILARRRD